MEMDHSEHEAIKETLEETKGLAKDLGIPLSEALLLRCLVCLRWLNNWTVNKGDDKLFPDI